MTDSAFNGPNHAEQAQARTDGSIPMHTVCQEYVTADGTSGPIVVLFFDGSVLYIASQDHQEAFADQGAFSAAHLAWEDSFEVYRDDE